jgi:hypothetical protein
MGVLEEKSKSQAEWVEELKVEWRRLWKERFEDKVRAEGVANDDYFSLFVEKGTVIFATRNFKSLSFKGILEEHGMTDLHRFVSPVPGVGGWRKFIRNAVLQGSSRSRTRRAVGYFAEEKKPQQLKKGGRGWLHK